MLELLAAFLVGCALVSLLYCYMEIRGEPSDDPQTQPPTDFLDDVPDSVKKAWEVIK